MAIPTTPKVAIIYYSSTGSVHALAQEYAKGLEGEGAEVRIRKVAELAPPEAVAANEAWQRHADETADVPEATADDVLWADAVVFGTPTRYGNVAAQLKQFIDTLGPQWAQGQLADKVYSGFTSTSTAHGGQESTLLALYNTVHHFGGITVTPGLHRPDPVHDGQPVRAVARGRQRRQPDLGRHPRGDPLRRVAHRHRDPPARRGPRGGGRRQCATHGATASRSARGQVGAQDVARRGHGRHLDRLLAGVGEVRVAGAEVQRRDAERREARDVGPPVLRDRRRRRRPRRTPRRPGRRARAAPPAPRRYDRARSPSKDLARRAPRRRRQSAVGREAEVDGTVHPSGTTLPATPPSMRTACRPSRYTQPSMSTLRAS